MFYKDLEGTEVKEWDVLEDPADKAKYYALHEDGKYILVWVSNEDRFDEIHPFCTSLKIIGNAKENPELIVEEY